MAVPGPRQAVPGVWRQSWFDALTDWVDDAPRQRVWIYHAAWLAALGLVIGPNVAARGVAAGEIYVFHFVLAGTAAYMAYFMHVTKRGFVASLEELEPMVDVDAEAFARLRRRIVTTPAVPTLVMATGFAFGGSLLLLPLAMRPELGLFGNRWEALAHGVLLFGTTFVIGTFVCRSLYRIVEVRRLHTHHLRVDLFRPEQLFSQTGVAARGGLTLILYTLAWVATVPGGLENLGFVALATLINVAAVALYVVPLYRLHGLLVTEKRRLIGAANECMRILSGRVHSAVASNDLSDIDALSKGLTALQTELAVLERASTWPWHPELSRVTVTALLVPALLWALQRVLQSWL